MPIFSLIVLVDFRRYVLPEIWCKDCRFVPRDRKNQSSFLYSIQKTHQWVNFMQHWPAGADTGAQTSALLTS